MRPWPLLLLAILALSASGADATPPAPAYEVDARLSGGPAVGEARDLTVSIAARLPLEAPLRLDVPPWVQVEGGDWNASIPEDGRASHTWRIEATRAGYWHASLSLPTNGTTYREPFDPSDARLVLPGCCLVARSDAGGGTWSADSEHAILPTPRVTHTLSARALDGERVELEFSAAPNASWMRRAHLHLGLGDLGERGTAFPAGEAGSVTHVVALAPGNGTVVAESLAVSVPIDAAYADARADPAPRVQVHCRNVHVLREGDTVREVDSRSCEALEHRPRSLPAPAAPALVLLVVLVAWCRPRAGHP